MADVGEAVAEESVQALEETVEREVSAEPEPPEAPPAARKPRKPRAKAAPARPPSPIEAPAAPLAPERRPRGRPAGSKNKVPDMPPLPPSADEIANRMLELLAERQSSRRHAQKQLYESWFQ